MHTSRRPLFRYVPALIFLIGVTPYVALKLCWLTGHLVGIQDPALAHSTFLWAANLLTFGMDAFAAALVLLMSFGRRRLPAWLLLVPMWVASGLLLPILIAEPLSLLGSALFPTATAPTPRLPLAPWVFTVVYLGFGVQAIALLAAFWLHAHDRWPDAVRGLGCRSDSPVEAALRPVLSLGATLATLAAALHVLAAVGHAGFSGIADYVGAGIAVGAAAAAVWLARGRCGRPRAGALFAVWACPASLFAWGLWILVAAIAPSAGGPLTQSSAHTLTTATALVKLLAGLVIGLASLVLAVVRRGDAGAVGPTR